MLFQLNYFKTGLLVSSWSLFHAVQPPCASVTQFSKLQCCSEEKYPEDLDSRSDFMNVNHRNKLVFYCSWWSFQWWFSLKFRQFHPNGIIIQDFFLIHIYSYNYVFRYDPKFVYHHTLLALILTEVRLDFDQ